MILALSASVTQFVQRKLMLPLPFHTVILDMDEVLVDFRRGAIWQHWHIALAKANRQRDYNLSRMDQLGDLVEWMHQRQIASQQWSLCGNGPLGITDDEFWQPITAAGATFWHELPKLSWCDSLLSIVSKHWPNNWYIATSPSQSETSYVGKLRWLKDHVIPLCPTFQPDKHFIPFGSKHLLAKPGVCLVDDRPDTVQKFIEHGGTGILFPSSGNCLHAFRHNPVEYILPQLLGDNYNKVEVL